MRSRSPTVCLVPWALAIASACTGPNPLYQLTTAGSVDGGGITSVGGQGGSGGQAGGGTGGVPFSETDAAGSSGKGGGNGDASTGGSVDGPRDSGQVDLAAGETTNGPDGSFPNPDVLPPDVSADVPAGASGPDAPGGGGGGGATSLLGYWRFDDGPMVGTVYDASGNGNHATLEGLNVSTAWVAGHTGFGIEFPPRGANDPSGIRIPVTTAIDNLRTFTIAAWIKRNTGSGSSSPWTVFSRQIAGTDDEIFNLSCNPTDLLAFIPKSSLGALSDVRGLGAAPNATWIHVAVTYDTSVLRLYAGGVQVASAAYANRLSSTTTPVYIGTNKNTTTNDPFEGIIDEVVLYSGALSAASIAALTAGASPYTTN